MTRDARDISRAFDLIFEACYEIQDHGGCEECPLSHLCLDDTKASVNEIADLMSAQGWDEFLNYADNATYSEDDIIAQYADAARKSDLEERDY